MNYSWLHKHPINVSKMNNMLIYLDSLIFIRLSKVDLKIQPDKCDFFVVLLTSVTEYFPQSQNQKIRILSKIYFQTVIKHSSNLLKSYNEFKQPLSSNHILNYPNFDKPFLLTTDLIAFPIPALLFKY